MSLEYLRDRISKCNRCGKNNFWYFPSIDGVKGFYGDKEYIFVATQPHLGDFPRTHNDIRLYNNMAKHGFGDAHLTDVVKCRGEKYKELSPIEISNCIRWFEEEMRIVKPKAIISLGKKAFDALMSIGRIKPVLWVTHYSAQVSDVDYEKEFEELRYYLDSGNYRHGMKMKDLITQEQRKGEETKEEYRQFVELLNQLRKEGTISAEDRRALAARWTREPHLRTGLLEHLKRLQKS